MSVITWRHVSFATFSNPDWWYAKEGDREGYVPSNYVAKEDTLETYEWV